MRLFHVFKRKLRTAIRRHVLRDPWLLESDRWRRDRGDATLRLDYPLDRGSTVLDLGGYRGDFAAALYARYGCRIFVFEPLPQFHAHCEARFLGIPAITCLDFGLASADGNADIGVDDDASSVVRHVSGRTQQIRLRSVVDVLRALDVGTIHLMKINIEGGEFDLLPALIDSGAVAGIVNLQIQFHPFVPDAQAKCDAIRAALRHTHEQTWNYPFVWENWRLRAAMERSPAQGDAR